MILPIYLRMEGLLKFWKLLLEKSAEKSAEYAKSAEKSAENLSTKQEEDTLKHRKERTKYEVHISTGKKKSINFQL